MKMKMKQLIALLLSLMLFALPCLSLAENNNASVGIIGGADGPTAIIVTDHTAAETDEGITEAVESPEKAEDEAAVEEKPLSLGQAGIYMLKGMVGIFLVTAMIIAVLFILEKATHKKEEAEQ